MITATLVHTPFATGAAEANRFVPSSTDRLGDEIATTRRCDAHHIEHWADGGPTSLENLVLLCRRHHRAVHDGGFEVTLLRDGTTIFIRPDGSVLEAAPMLPSPPTRLSANLRAPDDIPVWDGTPFDLAYAIDVLYAPRAPRTPTIPGTECLDDADTPMETGGTRETEPTDWPVVELS